MQSSGLRVAVTGPHDRQFLSKLVKKQAFGARLADLMEYSQQLIPAALRKNLPAARLSGEQTPY
jgi:hypothetical protein